MRKLKDVLAAVGSIYLANKMYGTYDAWRDAQKPYPFPYHSPNKKDNKNTSFENIPNQKKRSRFT